MTLPAVHHAFHRLWCVSNRAAAELAASCIEFTVRAIAKNSVRASYSEELRLFLLHTFMCKTFPYPELYLCGNNIKQAEILRGRTLTDTLNVVLQFTSDAIR